MLSYLRVLISLLAGMAPILMAYPNRVPAGNAGAPGDTNPPCSACHRVTLNPAGGKVELNLPGGLSWTSGQKQSWTVRISDATSGLRYGFQLTTRPQGTLTAPAGSATTVTSGYINHTASQTSYTFDWTPGEALSGDVTVYVAALAARGTSSGNLYTATYTLKQATGAAPRIDTARAAVNAASLQSPIAPASWVTIFGENLAPAGVSRTWRDEDIVNGQLPLSLEGVSVKINNRSAPVWYVSPTQLNILAPDDTATGAVSVQVTTAAGPSNTATATLAPVAPAYFCFDPQNRRYAAAVSGTGDYLGPVGLYSGTVATRPAQPGEIILLFGTGFGLTSPVVASGSAFSGAAPLVTAPRILIGGLPAEVLFGGLTGPGLYQFNLRVPDLPDGDHEIVAELSGVTSPGGVYLNVKR
jgi:uncharacterized protein (TIGR03437 family)